MVEEHGSQARLRNIWLRIVCSRLLVLGGLIKPRDTSNMAKERYAQ
jgi:hypothetical protein